MIFVDTNAWISLVDDKDRFYTTATRWFQKDTSLEFVTTNLVIIESLGWLRYNKGRSASIELGRRFYESADLKIERVTLIDEKRAWELFRKIDSRGVSMIDCTSFVVMKRLKVGEVFTFDQDFKKLGFTVYP